MTTQTKYPLSLARCLTLGLWLLSSLALNLALPATAALADQLIASVDRNSLSLQETLTLTVSADSRTRGQPDFSVLKSDFDILSNQQSQFTSITNQGTEFKKVWQLTLAPKREGRLLIPSFAIESLVSDAIEISVSKQSQTAASADQPVRVTLEVDKKSVFVQEQVLVTLKLISEVNLSQAEIQPLAIKDAVVIPLSDKPKQYVSMINGKQHLILETHYAIFPQMSGEMVIPSMIYSVVPSVERDFFARQSAQLLRVPTEELHIDVKPVPGEASAKSWQPASQLSLNQTWSASLDHLKMGEPVTRTVTLSAKGLTGGQILPLNSEPVAGLTFYPDQAHTSDDKSEQGLTGTRVETMAIIPNRGGEFTLPEIRVDWWDTNSQTMQTATLPAQNIRVLGAAAPADTPANGMAQNAPALAAQDLSGAASVATGKSQLIWLWASTLFFGLLSLGFGLYLLQLRSQLKRITSDQAHLDDILLSNEKQLWNALQQAANLGDLSALRRHLLQWAKLQWPDAPIQVLDDVAKLAGKLELTLAFKQLDEMLYSNHPHADWQASSLLKLLQECRKQKFSQPSNRAPVLKPLYQG